MRTSRTGRTGSGAYLAAVSNEAFNTTASGELDKADLIPLNWDTEDVALAQEIAYATTVEAYAAAVAQEKCVARYAEDGGMSKETAEMVMEHFTTLAALTGVSVFHDDNGKETLSLESFDVANGKTTQTILALEFIRHKIKDFWKAVVARIMAIWEKLKGYYLTYLDKSGTLISGAAKLKERAVAMSKDGYKLKSNDGKVKGTFKVSLSIKEDFTVTPLDLINGIKLFNLTLSKIKTDEVEKETKNIIADIKTIDLSNKDKMIETVSAYTKKRAAFGIAAAEATLPTIKFTPVVANEDDPISAGLNDTDTKLVSTEVFPGLYRVTYTEMKQKDSSGADVVTSAVMAVEYGGSKKREKERGETNVDLKYFTLNEIPGICDAISTCAATVKDLKMDWQKRNDQAKLYIAELNTLHKKYISMTEEMKNLKEGLIVSGMFTGAFKSSKIFHEPMGSLQEKALSTMGHALDWVKLSISNHEK
jgi:hypothetical protein